MAARFVALLLIFQLAKSLATQEAEFRCFDTPQTTADRSSVTINIGRIYWLSHGLVSTVAELALRELLGYSVHRSELPDSWSFGPALAS
eukprot:3249918-Amphidinium_carterae.1